MHRGRASRASLGLESKLSMIGREKPRVFPVPVLALPTTSRPSSAGPSTAAWISKSVSIPLFFSAAFVKSDNGKLSTCIFSASGTVPSLEVMVGAAAVERARRGAAAGLTYSGSSNSSSSSSSSLPNKSSTSTSAYRSSTLFTKDAISSSSSSPLPSTTAYSESVEIALTREPTASARDVRTEDTDAVVTGRKLWTAAVARTAAAKRVGATTLPCTRAAPGLPTTPPATPARLIAESKAMPARRMG
mmetsp:Transcript_11132/g.41248  ORF Transcript_11132/g.41248 Transcript_11132/m.41248 type:complete len:246 (-) Transcript_11132:251-988(-)